MKKEFDIYDFTGLLAPGTVALLGAMFLIPSLRPLSTVLTTKDVSVGELGLFVMVAYVVGQFVQAVGSILEPKYEEITGGKPSLEVLTGKSTLLAQPQIEVLFSIIPKHLGLAADVDTRSLRGRDWLNLVAQMFAVISVAKCAARANLFYANYALFRGLTTSFLALAGISLLQVGPFHQPMWAFLAAVCVCLLRMRRFSEYYAREVFIQFLQVVNAPKPTTKPEEEKPEKTRDDD
jgi:hypothetical protein